MAIEEQMYNNKYIIRDAYNKQGPPFRLKLDQTEFSEA
jgi:hypothetical protein